MQATHKLLVRGLRGPLFWRWHRKFSPPNAQPGFKGIRGFVVDSRNALSTVPKKSQKASEAKSVQEVPQTWTAPTCDSGMRQLSTGTEPL